MRTRFQAESRQNPGSLLKKNPLKYSEKTRPKDWGGAAPDKDAALKLLLWNATLKSKRKETPEARQQDEDCLCRFFFAFYHEAEEGGEALQGGVEELSAGTSNVDFSDAFA